MDIKYLWRDLYQAALLEVRPEELWLRIGEAEKAIQRRIEELRGSDTSSGDECQALDDASRMLRFIASTECRTPLPTVPTSNQDKAAS
jgi:hypothetical protein